MPAQDPSQQPPAPQQPEGEASNSRAPENAGMHSPDQNKYSNKESAKVNSGLGFNLPESTDMDTSDSFIESGSFSSTETSSTHAPDLSSAFSSNQPAISIDFSLLLPPPVIPEPAPSLQRLVYRLLNPPSHVFPYGTLSIQWVIGAMGYRHFAFRESDERWVLKRDSELRESGREMGIPAVLWEWLVGDDK